MDHATQMILDLCGGEASEVVIAGAIPDHSRAYRLDTDRVQSLVGMEIPAEEQRETLTALGFELDGDMSHVPSWRPDVLGSGFGRRGCACRIADQAAGQTIAAYHNRCAQGDPDTHAETRTNRASHDGIAWVQ